jgi:hypothetical protein
MRDSLIPTLNMLHKTACLLAVATIASWCPPARCDTTVAGSPRAARATEFVVTVATRDLARAHSAEPHGLSYPANETVPALAAEVRDWLTDRGDTRLRLDPADRLTLFALYWSAQQMPDGSPCFRDPDDPACVSELTQWLDEARSGSPAFIAAYKDQQTRLRLPPISN